ncbi:hypothetical protein ACFV8Z_27555 [Streptomyces sp. NPDC059837]|uniref:hypothetical protein n=1 Tax=Streptomyces sp. NPDC059837 TaxID=3346968 RepID=UPI0036680353
MDTEGQPDAFKKEPFTGDVDGVPAPFTEGAQVPLGLEGAVQHEVVELVVDLPAARFIKTPERP